MASTTPYYNGFKCDGCDRLFQLPGKDFGYRESTLHVMPGRSGVFCTWCKNKQIIKKKKLQYEPKWKKNVINDCLYTVHPSVRKLAEATWRYFHFTDACNDFKDCKVETNKFIKLQHEVKKALAEVFEE